MADGRVVFEVVGDPKGINITIKNVTANIEKESKKWDNAAASAADGASGVWAAAAGKIVGALSAAGVVSILSKWGRAAIESASDLEEVQNVVDVTFGEGATKIESWSKAAGKAFGLTETQAKKYTSTLGAMMKSQGIADNEIVQMSTDLSGLAADMASFYNLDFDTAFQKIRSGISGETEPMKQLGIDMSAANLEAFRLEQGIEKSYAAMSQGEQTALRYQYIMKATADAQGDFARTSDGYANASRRVQTAMETIKTEGGKLLLEVVEPLTVGLASMLEKLTATPDTTVLDDIAAIDEKTDAKVSRIQQTAEDARLLADELVSLGDKEKLTGDRQAYWLETTNRLLKTLPGLSTIINGQTGELNGGTQAIYDYIKAWEEGQTKLAMMGALQQKENAISERFADLPGLELDMAVAQRRLRKQKELIEKTFSGFGFNWKNGSAGVRKSIEAQLADMYSGDSKKYYELVGILDDLIGTYDRLSGEATSATDAYNKQKDALDEAKAALEEYMEVVAEMPGDTEAAAAAADKLTQAQNAAAEASVEAVKTAISAMADYAQSVHDATEQAVNSVVKGFNALSRPTTELEEKRSRLIEQQMELNRSTKEGAKRYAELQEQIDEINKSLDKYTTNGMQDALKSQLAFMEDYISNLEKARQMGLSDELLASLSDGSVESAQYLASLVEDPEAAAEVDRLYQLVQQKKQEFTDSLTDQKLAADDIYSSLVETAKSSIAELNLSAEASDAMGQTVSGLAEGILSHVPEVKDAVDALQAQLDRLSGFGISTTVNAFGSFDRMRLHFGGFSLDGTHATGLDYVPFDGYLAGLHEGEGILTAEENRIWQRFKNGASPQTMDYDALGATMRDNIQPGGNVYLDGRTVGKVISQQQGDSFRALQRSGWQG